jgi:hypothetical protein
MVLKFQITFLLLSLTNALSAQQYYFTNTDTIPCNCRGYYVLNSGDTSSVFYLNDKGRTSLRKEYRKDGVRLDSIKYYENDLIKEIKVTIFSGSIGFVYSDLFEYSKTGKLTKIVSYNNLGNQSNVRSTEYKWDSKGRPKLIFRKYKDEVDSIRFEYINDTIAKMFFSKNGTLVKTGNRIYNKKYQILDEVLENPANGRKVHFKFKYNAIGQLLYVHRVTVVKGMVGFFGSEHYDELTGKTKKIEFLYDEKFRRIKKIVDDSDVIYTTEYIYF